MQSGDDADIGLAATKGNQHAHADRYSHTSRQAVSESAIERHRKNNVGIRQAHSLIAN